MRLLLVVFLLVNPDWLVVISIFILFHIKLSSLNNFTMLFLKVPNNAGSMQLPSTNLYFLLASKEVLNDSHLQYIDIAFWDNYSISISVNNQYFFLCVSKILIV